MNIVTHLARNSEEIISTPIIPNKTRQRRRRRGRDQRRRAVGEKPTARRIRGGGGGTKRARIVENRTGNWATTDTTTGAVSSSDGSGGGDLQLALAAAGPGASVLEPVEDVGIADGAVLLEDLADLDGLVLGRVHGPAVEDVLKYLDLLRLWRPPRPDRFRAGRGGPLAWARDVLILFIIHNNCGANWSKLQE